MQAAWLKKAKLQSKQLNLINILNNIIEAIESKWFNDQQTANSP